MGYEIPLGSKEDHENSSSFSPVDADDYVVKIGKIILELQPTWNNGVPNYEKKEFGYTVIVSPAALKGGGDMEDVEGNKAEPLSGYIFRPINPFSLGFQQDKCTPSFMRGFICYMRNMSINTNPTAEDFVLISPDGQKIIDEKDYKDQYWEEITGKKPKDLIKQGYKHIPDVRMYEGKYIGCAVEVQDKKGKLKNKISKWSKLPSNFVEPTDEECATFKENIDKFWNKILEGRSGRANATPASKTSDVIEEAGEVEIEEVAI